MKNNHYARYLFSAVIDYLGGKCMYCGKKEYLHIHHIIPTRLGGPDRLSNFELVCPSCHNKIHKEINKLFPIEKIGKKDELLIKKLQIID